MDSPMDAESEPVILDKEDPNAPPMQLVYPNDDSEDEFRPKHHKDPSKSWHMISTSATTRRHAMTRPVSATQPKCSCRLEDFRPAEEHQEAATSCSTTLTTQTEINPRNLIHLKGKLGVRYVLETMLTSAMAKELEASEAHRSLHVQDHALDDCLAYVAQYLDCVSLETCSLARVCTHVMRSQLGTRVEAPGTPDNTCTFASLLKQLAGGGATDYHWVRKEIAATLAPNAELDQLVRDYKEKKADFHKAIGNLRLILDTNFTTTQLQKLRKQFDLIQEHFLESLQQLHAVLPKVIAVKTQMLVNTFGMLGDDLQAISNERNDFSLVCQHLETSLQEEIGVLHAKSTDSILEDGEVEEHHLVPDHKQQTS